MCLTLHLIKTDPPLGSGNTDPDGAVATSSANGLVGTGFASWYRLQLRADFKRTNGLV